MRHLGSSFLLVLSLAACYANENGVVLDFAASGDFSYIYSKQENDQTLADFWLTNDKGNKNLFHVVCIKMELNSKSKHVISEYRANILTVDNFEIDSFEVTECNQDKLVKSMKGAQLRDEENRKEYQIFIKDAKRDCRKRTYKLEITSNPVSSISATTRSSAESVSRMKCPIASSVEGIVSDWYEEGQFNDDSPFGFKNAVRRYRFGGNKCENCWIFCTEEQSEKGGQIDRYVAVILSDIPIDRIKVSSCTLFSLQSSIKYDYGYQIGDRYKKVSINYLKTDGSCHYRSYQYDILTHEDQMLERVYLKREDPNPNPDCKTMKVRGKVRYIAKIAQRHFGRVTNPPTDITGQDDTE